MITILIIAIAGFTVYATASGRVYNYRIYAVEYASGIYPTQWFRYLHTEEEMTVVTCYIWVIKGAPGGPIVVDMGREPWVGAILEAQLPPPVEYISPAEALAKVDVDPAEVKTVIITHMHWDHAGVFYSPFVPPDWPWGEQPEFPFPNAKFYIQKTEWETYMEIAPQDPWLKEHFYHLATPFYEAEMAVWSYFYSAGRVELVDGDVEIVPGVRLIKLAGHTPGHQIVTVSTKVEDAVIASDILMLYENLEEPWPIGFFWNLGEVRFGAQKIEELATSGIIFPGHDPLVLERYPSDIEGVAKAP